MGFQMWTCIRKIIIFMFIFTINWEYISLSRGHPCVPRFCLVYVAGSVSRLLNVHCCSQRSTPFMSRIILWSFKIELLLVAADRNYADSVVKLFVGKNNAKTSTALSYVQRNRVSHIYRLVERGFYDRNIKIWPRFANSFPLPHILWIIQLESAFDRWNCNLFVVQKRIVSKNGTTVLWVCYFEIVDSG